MFLTKKCDLGASLSVSISSRGFSLPFLLLDYPCFSSFIGIGMRFYIETDDKFHEVT